MKRHSALEIAGSEVLLLAEKALYWPHRKMLCIADTHFGKAAAYRALGQPVPHGTTAANLLRLDVLLARYPVNLLVFLGDFLHAPKSRSPAILAALQAWRQRHAGLKCVLIRGNHDFHAGDPPAGMDIEIVNEPLLLGPFALRHTPARHAGSYVISGHVHPVFELNGKGHQRLRLPCFHSTDEIMVLPSFGDFTGGYQVQTGHSSRIFVTDGNSVWPVPAQTVRSKRIAPVWDNVLIRPARSR
ncbi:MAG: ligase-associated DNA damage response endonuclease PdeM [Burkholderiales bacterium]